MGLGNLLRKKDKPSTAADEKKVARQNTDKNSRSNATSSSRSTDTKKSPKANKQPLDRKTTKQNTKQNSKSSKKDPSQKASSLSASEHGTSSGDDQSSSRRSSMRRSRNSAAGSNPKLFRRSTSSAIGLDEMIEDRREAGHLGENVVHIEAPCGKPIEDVYSGVHDGPILGAGISGVVRLVTHKATGLKYAAKVLDLGMINSPLGLEQLRQEISIMCQLDHPNVVRLEEVYESSTAIFLVEELCLGGELFARLDEQPDYHYTEAGCALLVKQMLSAVRYLHQKGIVHRDLKLENFLFSSMHPDSELKIIDFGLSKHFQYGQIHHETVGTPYTVAPEVIRSSYDERCDLWAIGVITFLLLSGDPPFGGCGGPEPLEQVRVNILRGSYSFEPAYIWEQVSPQAKDFISKLLVTDPQNRPTAREAQQHEWVKEWAANRRKKGREDRALKPEVVRALVNFKDFSDMRRLLHEVLSFTLRPDQIKDLRLEFEKMDTDQSGEISLGALKQVLMQNAETGSLGTLTEEEVTDIFDAMRVNKTETHIHWHEFIAAGLGSAQSSVDDRNLRLAFERLDADHKGHITLDDVMDLMGSDALQSKDAVKRMWLEAVSDQEDQDSSRITYSEFLRLMKGQKQRVRKEVEQEAKPAAADTVVSPKAIASIELSRSGSRTKTTTSLLSNNNSLQSVLDAKREESKTVALLDEENTVAESSLAVPQQSIVDQIVLSMGLFCAGDEACGGD